MENIDLYDRIQVRVNEMRRRREPIISFWEDIQRYMLPWHGRNLGGESASEVDDVTRDHSEIFSQAPEDAIDRLAAGFQFGMTPRTDAWFAMTLDDMDVADKHGVREYLHEVERRMRLVFARSNLYDVLHHFYIELIGFGTAALACLEDEETVVRFKPFTAGEYLISQNHRGEVDCFYRELWMTARQMVERFGEDNISWDVNAAMADGQPEKLFRVCQMIEPNTPQMKGLNLIDKKFRSVYYEKNHRKEDRRFLEVKGYNEFPVMVGRWRVVGDDVWGRGPGMKVLPDVKSLYKITENTLIALDKVLDPPMVVPGSMKNDYIDRFPGGVSFSEDMTGADSFRPLYQIRPDIKSAEYIKEQLASAIQRGFFNDIFLMLTNTPDTKRMTAYEVQGRKEEKMTMLGPVLGRLQGELLGQLIDRTFAVMSRAGLFPEPPAEIQGKNITVKYLSILARAQESGVVNAMMQLLNFTGALAQVKEDVLDKLNADGMFEEFADAIGAPPSVMVGEQDVQAQRQARAEAMQQQQQMAMAQSAAQTAETASKTKMGEDNLLDRVARQADEQS